MYETFFALKEKPFIPTPNPRFLFLSETHNEVYAHLLYGIENRSGFIEVTGEIGTGKTTILRTLLAHLEEDLYRVAFIFNPKLTAFELLRNINREFGVADNGLNSPDLIHALNDFLLAENKAGRIPVLVIDEAQNLSGEVLEQIRLLSNLETENDKLIQIVLVGQPELRKNLSDHSLRQLNQRIAVRYQLRSLNRAETAAYIRHRLKIAGRPDGNIFSSKALAKVYQHSGGTPRRINLICDRALLIAYSDERGVVSARDIRQAAAELRGIHKDSSQQWWHQYWLPFVIVTVLLLIAGGVFQMRALTGGDQVDTANAQVDIQPAAATAFAGVVEASKPLRQVSPAVAQVSPSDSLLLGCNALFKLWGAPTLAEDTATQSFDFDREFGQRGFKLARLSGTFDDWQKYNLPLLIPLSEEQGGGYIAVLQKESANGWVVAPDYQGKKVLSAAELSQLGVHLAFMPWVDFASIGYVAVPGVKSENVRRLQFLLGLTGCPQISTSGRFDHASIECVKDFQRTNQLTVDGMVGPRTLVQLYQAAGAYDMPRLN